MKIYRIRVCGYFCDGSKYVYKGKIIRVLASSFEEAYNISVNHKNEIKKFFQEIRHHTSNRRLIRLSETQPLEVNENFVESSSALRPGTFLTSEGFKTLTREYLVLNYPEYLI